MIQVTTQKAQLGFQTNNAKIEYTQAKGKWDMTTQKAQMEVSEGLPQIRIDQTVPFAEAGLKTIFMLNQEYADLGRQYAMEGIARRAREGDMMARPPYGNAVQQIVMSKLPTRADFNIKFIPQSRPEIDFVNLEKDIFWQLGGSQRTYNISESQFNYSPGGVDIYMEQFPSINFQYINTKV